VGSLGKVVEGLVWELHSGRWGRLLDELVSVGEVVGEIYGELFLWGKGAVVWVCDEGMESPCV
jgi:hypothetical protein